jgi:hypothetical protein
MTTFKEVCQLVNFVPSILALLHSSSSMCRGSLVVHCNNLTPRLATTPICSTSRVSWMFYPVTHQLTSSSTFHMILFSVLALSFDILPQRTPMRWPRRRAKRHNTEGSKCEEGEGAHAGRRCGGRRARGKKRRGRGDREIPASVVRTGCLRR